MGTSLRQTETERNRHAFRIGHCAWDHAKNTSLIKELEIYRERERETESKTERHTKREKNRDKIQEREGETQRGKDREVSSTPGRSIEEVSPKQSTVMRRTASLRFAALATQ